MQQNYLRNKFIIALSVLVSCLDAQVFLPHAESAFEPQHHFNPGFIKARNIRKIVFEIIDKKDFEVAVDKNLTETYEFNADGLLSKHYYTTIARTVERQVSSRGRRGVIHTRTIQDFIYDTVSTSYFYDAGKLILKRYHDGLNYYESRYYHYDSVGFITKELRIREINNSPDRHTFILGNQVLLSVDSFQYRRFSSGQVKCVFLNSENRPYKEVISNYDSLGRKKDQTESYTAAGWIMQGSKFTYESKRLVRADFEGNAGTPIHLSNTYEYDETGELYSEKQYKNEVLVKEISYVTARNDALLNSVVIRDPVNKTIRIIRLKYDTSQVSSGFLGR